MTMKQKDLKILNKMNKERNWTENTFLSYTAATKVYIKLNNTTLSELITEAENEEKNNISWKKTILRKRLVEYRQYLFDNYTLSVAKLYLQRIKTIYGHYDIGVYELPYISEKGAKKYPPISFKDLPDQEIITEAINISSPLMKAIILFISSSGCARAETLNLTIKDFIESTKEYHNINMNNNENEEKIINEAIKNLIKQDQVIPTFNIRRQKTGNYYFTFCSFEAVKSILNYLITRQEKINLNSKLFKIHKKHFLKKFVEINKKLNLGKVGDKNRFRSHMLRKYHASHLAMSKQNPKTGEYIPGMNMEDIDALQGRVKTGSQKSYFFDDFEGIKKMYIQSLDKLTIFEDGSNVYKNPEYIALENKLKEKENVIETQEKEKEKIMERLNNQDEKIEELLKLTDLLN